jgi:hypothetical protein
LQAGRTQNTLPLLKKAKRAILLSGTPALNRPTELLTQLQGLLPKAAITKTAFEGRYAKIVDCGRFKKNVSTGAGGCAAAGWGGWLRLDRSAPASLLTLPGSAYVIPTVCLLVVQTHCTISLHASHLYCCMHTLY